MNYETISGFDWLLHQDFPEAFPLQPTNIFDIGFVSESARSLGGTSQLFRLGAYDPIDESGDVELCGPIACDCPDDLAFLRRTMSRAYRLARTMPDSTRALAIFPVDRDGRLLQTQGVD